MAQPHDEPSDREKGNRPSKGRRRLVIVGAIVLIVGLAVGAYYYWESRFYVSTDDAYVEGHPVFISTRVAGVISQVHVRENERVEEGTPVVEVDPCDYQIRLAKAQAAFQSAKADEQQAAAAVEVARADWDKQQKDLSRNQELAQQGAVTEQALEHSQAAARSSQASLSAAERHLIALQAKTAESRVAIDEARLQLSYTAIRSPTPGYVTQKNVEVGTYVNVGQPLVAVVPDRMYVIANYKETQLTHMRPGQQATIKVDAYPGVVWNARVDSIQAGTGAAFSLFPPENATGNFVKIVQRVPVKITFDEPPDPNHRLVLGMSVIAKVWIRDKND
ncbi:MAG: HlyD family secretion protein [Solirubrobacterales bacterium]